MFNKKLFSHTELLLILNCIIISIIPLQASQTTIGEVINTYTPVIDISATSVTVNSSHGFQPGDKILIIQIKGAEIDESESSNYGKIINIKQAGTYEINRIATINDKVLGLSCSLVKSYDTKGAVQIIRIPEYDTAYVSTTLSCASWNGETGGILVFQANVIILNADIDVSSKGFRGGQSINSSNYASTHISEYRFESNPSKGGLKGESIANLSQNNFIAGKGAPANGGGGGNNHNGGGGGGGLGGCGGLGAWAFSPSFPGQYKLSQGTGGYAIQADHTDRIFLGGGGGAAHQNDNQGTDGGNGGGGIFIIAKKLIGNNKRILSNGSNTKNTVHDGAGGAGAGGEIILFIDELEGLSKVSLRGGNAGNASTGVDGCHPPGGGGGGGILYTKIPLPEPLIDLSGGRHGDCSGSPHGSTSGCDGILLKEFSFIHSENLAEAGLDQTICKGGLAELYAKGTGSCKWYPPTGLNFDNIPNPIASPSYTTRYYVTFTTVDGCFATDSLLISVVEQNSADAGDDVTICRGGSVRLSAKGIGACRWNPNYGLSSDDIPDPEASPDISTKYYITFTSENGCTSVDSLIVFVSDQPNIVKLSILNSSTKYIPSDTALIKLIIDKGNLSAPITNLSIILQYDLTNLDFPKNSLIKVKAGFKDWKWDISENPKGVITMSGSGPALLPPVSIAEFPLKVLLYSDSTTYARLVVLKANTNVSEQCAKLLIIADSVHLGEFCFDSGRNIHLSNKIFSLADISPNPNSGEKILIVYSVAFPVETKIFLYNSMGEQIGILINRQKAAGVHTAIADSEKLSAGVYYYRMEAGPFIETKKFILQK